MQVCLCIADPDCPTCARQTFRCSTRRWQRRCPFQTLARRHRLQDPLLPWTLTRHGYPLQQRHRGRGSRASCSACVQPRSGLASPWPRQAREASDGRPTQRRPRGSIRLRSIRPPCFSLRCLSLTAGPSEGQCNFLSLLRRLYNMSRLFFAPQLPQLDDIPQLRISADMLKTRFTKERHRAD